jgi:hypothetical protein
MKTLTIELFKFEELKDDVQTKVLADYKNSLEYFDDGVIEDLVDLLEHLGFSEIGIDYSLDYSHVPFAKVTGKFSKIDLSFVKQNYMKLHNVSEIVELLEPVIVCDYDVESETLGFFYDIMKLVNEMAFKMIESDYINYYSHESLLENLLSDDCDYWIDGTVYLG